MRWHVGCSRKWTGAVDEIAPHEPKEKQMTITSNQVRPLLVAGLLSACVAGTVVATAADTPAATPPSTSTATQPAPNASAGKSIMDTKVAAPSKAESPDTAFRKLDYSGKGYVTKDDTSALSGFEKAFQDNDANHDGKLTADEFRKAWSEFSGNKY